MHTKLFIPGPVEVSPKTFAAFCEPLIGHRSGDFKKLYASIQPRLQELFGTKQPVFLSTSSAWGVMEGSIRNLVQKRVLNCMCGAFSDKWLDVSKRCGKDAEALQVEWGQPILPAAAFATEPKKSFDVASIKPAAAPTVSDLHSFQRTGPRFGPGTASRRRSTVIGRMTSRYLPRT